MGMTELRVRVVISPTPAGSAEVDMVVDSDAVYSVVPAGLLRATGVSPRETEVFGPANGGSVRRDVSVVRYEIAQGSGAAPVISSAAGATRPSSAPSRSRRWDSASTR